MVVSDSRINGSWSSVLYTRSSKIFLYLILKKNTLTYAYYLLATDLHQDFILQTNLKPEVKYKEGQLYLIVTKLKC